MATNITKIHTLDAGVGPINFSDFWNTAPPPVGGTTTRLFLSDERLAKIQENIDAGSVQWNGMQDQLTTWLEDLPYNRRTMILQYVLSFLITGNTQHLTRGKELYLDEYNQSGVTGGFSDYNDRNEYRGHHMGMYFGYAWLVQAGALNSSEIADMQSNFNDHVDYWTNYTLSPSDGDELIAFYSASGLLEKIITDPTRLAAIQAFHNTIYNDHIIPIMDGVSAGGVPSDGPRYGFNTHHQYLSGALIDFEVDGTPLPSYVSEHVDWFTRAFKQGLDGKMRFRDTEGNKRFESFTDRSYNYTALILQAADILNHQYADEIRRIQNMYALPSTSSSNQSYLWTVLFEDLTASESADFSQLPSLYDAKGQGRSDYRVTPYNGGHHVIIANDTYGYHHLHYNGMSFEWYLDNVELTKELTNYLGNGRLSNSFFIENADEFGRVAPTGRAKARPSAGHHGIGEANGTFWKAMSNKDHFNMSGFYSTDYVDQSTRHQLMITSLGLGLVYDHILTSTTANRDLNQYGPTPPYDAPVYREISSQIRMMADPTDDGDAKLSVYQGRELRAKEILSGGTSGVFPDTFPAAYNSDFAWRYEVTVPGTAGVEDTEFLWVLQGDQAGSGNNPVATMCTVTVGDSLVRAVKVSTGGSNVLAIFTQNPEVILTSALEIDLGEPTTGFDVYLCGVDKDTSWAVANPSGNLVSLTPGSGTVPTYHTPSASFTDDGAIVIDTSPL